MEKMKKGISCHNINICGDRDTITELSFEKNFLSVGSSSVNYRLLHV